MTDEQRAALMRELAKEIEAQDQAWAEVQAAVGAMGDVELAVPEEFFEALDHACARKNATPVNALAMGGLRA